MKSDSQPSIITTFIKFKPSQLNRIANILLKEIEILRYTVFQRTNKTPF